MLRLEPKWIRMLKITTVLMVLMGPLRLMVLARIMITVAMAEETTGTR